VLQRPNTSGNMIAPQDVMFADIAALESHAAKLRVGARLATPLSSVQGSTPKTYTTFPTFDSAKARLATINAGEIARLEKQLKSYKPGTTTHSAIVAKVARLRGETPKPFVKSAANTTQPTSAKPLTTTQKIFQAKGLPMNTKFVAPIIGGAINEADEVSDE